MLLIDGVRYQEWEISNEDELEQMVIEHAQDIFGENSIYFDKKQKLKSLAGVGSIPDGLVIMFGSVPQWHIVEVELSSHDPYAHIVPQVDKFINGIDNQNTRNKLVDTLYNLINSDELLRRETRQAIGLDKDIHKFLADLITTPPTITIIIEKDTDQLKEALRKYAQKKVIEFQTLTREGTEGLVVHAHLFEPMFQRSGMLTDSHGNRGFISTKERGQKLRREPAKRGLRLYVKDGKRYNPKEALEALGATLNKMMEGRGDLRATMPDGTIFEYVGSSKNGKSRIPKVHAYLLDHGFTFSQQ